MILLNPDCILALHKMQNKQVHVQAPALGGSDSVGFMWSASQTSVFLKASQVIQMYFWMILIRSEQEGILGHEKDLKWNILGGSFV